MKKFFIRFIMTIILLYFVGYGIVVLINIWTKELDLQKTLPNPFSWVHFKGKFIPPEATYNLINLQEKYQEGFEVYGVKWKQDYLAYKFIFSNNSTKTPMEDIRLYFEFPGVLIKEQISQVIGVENITASSNNEFGRAVLPTGVINKTVKYYTNLLTISMGKANPRSYLSYNLVFQEVNDSNDGHFIIEFSYFDPNKSDKITKRTVNPIKEKNKSFWFVDKGAEIKGSYSGVLLYVPESTIVFTKNGIHFGKQMGKLPIDPDSTPPKIKSSR